MKWFHKKDGGLIKVPLDPYFSLARCSICKKQWSWSYIGSSKEPMKIGGRPSDWASFSDLPEDLQAAALEEML